MPRGHSYCPVHSIPFMRPPYGPGTALQSLQHTLPSGRAYPRYPAYPEKFMERLKRPHTRLQISQPRRALYPSGCSKNRTHQQSKGLYVASAIKVAMAWVPRDPPVRWMVYRHFVVTQYYFSWEK